MMLNCIAIDDEPPALDLLNRYIGQTPFLRLLGSFSNAIDGLRFLSETQVDVLFLDIQMPDLSGVELARILTVGNSDQNLSIIFTTAFDQFAMEGYKLAITDYLLKPFGYEDFIRAASKALKWYQLSDKPKSLQAGREDFLYIKVEFQTVKIPCDSILYIEGLKDYAKLHIEASEKSILSLITLKALEEKLPKGKFMRIHKSFIISLSKVTSVTKNAVYIGKSMFPVSELFRDEFNKFLSAWH